MKSRLLSTAFLLLGGFSLSAADGRIPISSAPFTISAPGNYYLTADLTPPAGVPITINADNVVLDLGGHLITVPTGNFGIIALNHADITVKNGRVTGSTNGVILYVSAAAPALPHYRVEGVEVTNSTQYGIAVFSTLPGNHARTEVIGNRAAKIAGVGFFLSNLDHSLILNNIAEEITSGGSGGGSCFSFQLTNNSVISGNLASQCQFEGLPLFQCLNNRIEGNHAAGTGIAGLRVYSNSSGNQILGNTVSVCASGVSVAGNGNLMDGNVISTCSGQAINVSGNNNGYANNHTMNNGTNGVVIAGGAGNFNGGGNY